MSHPYPVFVRRVVLRCNHAREFTEEADAVLK